MTTKVRPNITVDKVVWKYWMARPDVNVSGMINSFLKDKMEPEIAEGEQ